MTENDAIKLVMIMQAAYPSAPVRKETAMAYHLGLSDVPYEAAERAVAAIMRTSKFMPTVAEIREALTEAAAGIEPWFTAWEELATTMQRYGSYLFKHKHHQSNWPGWSDPLVEAAVRHVGYEHVCNAEEEKLETIKAQFRNFYTAEANRRKQAIQVGDAALPAANIRALKKGDVA